MALETFEAGYAGARPARTGSQWSGMWKLAQVTDRQIDGKWPSPWSVAGGTQQKSFALIPGDSSPTDIQFNDDGTKFYILGNTRDTIYQYTCATAWDINTSVYSEKSFYVGNQETSANGLFFKSDGTKFYVVGQTNDTIYQYACSVAWDISTASYENKSVNISSRQGSATGLFFKPDGTTFYIIGSGSGQVRVDQYSCSTAWDVSTASYANKNIGVNTQDSAPTGLFFKSDGTTFYVVGDTNNTVFQYSCSTAWDVSTGSYSTKSFSVVTQQVSPFGTAFKSDGTQFYVIGSSPTAVSQYSCATAWDVSTASYGGKAFYIGGGQETNPGDVQFNDDGTKFYIIGSANDSVYQYSCSIAWDVSTGSFAGKSFYIGLQEGSATGLFFKADGTKFYVLGITNDTVYQYSCSTAWDISTASYDSKSFSVNAQETVPTALFFKSDGTKFYIIGANNKTVYQYSCSTAWDVSTASYDTKSFSVTTQESDPRGLFFKSDGTKFYIVGQTNDTVYQYSCSTAWDVSTASYDNKSFSVTTQDVTPNGLFFKDDGTKFYVVGTTYDTIFQYSCATAWDVSTGSYDNKLYRIVNEESDPRGLFFKSDGAKFYVVGNIYDTVFQYSCSTAWDVNTGTYENKAFTVTTQEGQPESLFFKSDGTKFYILGSSNRTVYQYSCSTAWDVSTASYDSKSFSVNTQESVPKGLFFKSDGTKFYVVGQTNDTIYQYSCTTPWDISTSYYELKSFYIGSQEGTTTGLFFKDDGTKFYIVGATSDLILQYSCATAWDVSTGAYDGISFSILSQDTTSGDIQFKSDGTVFYMLGATSSAIYQYSGLLE